MIIADGLKENEIVALADPFAKPGAKGQEKPQPGGGSPWEASEAAEGEGAVRMTSLPGYFPELIMGLSSLMAHKLRSLLTMLGMIFGVGAVVAMLSITAGAQKEMMSYIDLLGVNNIIIEAKEAVDRDELQARRAVSPGLTFRDFRAIRKRPWLESPNAAKAVQAAKILPKRLRNCHC